MQQEVSREGMVSKEPLQDAGEIRPLSHKEAGVLARAELERFLALVESLTDEEWNRPTACTLWNVQEIVAHQAGACAGYARWSEFKRQFGAMGKKREGQLTVDAMNEVQVGDRAGASPAELIAELREVGPKAIGTRQRLPWLLRALVIPFGPPLGTVNLAYLTDLIYSRDMWSHRLDICQATGREMVLSPKHDGRIVELIVRDLAKTLPRALDGASIVLNLVGPAGGTWRIGESSEPEATIRMDALDFCLLASGRMAPEEAIALAAIEGDHVLARRTLENAVVPF
ncbi:MAG: maleylpyruvate isomerase family mycothiol-dependent enzyme [Chloroflexota bacterium]|nr:maleylpyruvate isomerase family mycothiol-dependent enzyme [Chloroflexota bacterium]